MKAGRYLIFTRLPLLNKFLTYCLTPLPLRFGRANEAFQNSKVKVCVTETEFIFLNVGSFAVRIFALTHILVCQKMIFSILRSNSSVQTPSLFLLK